MASKRHLSGALPLILVLGLVTAFDAMSIDMYLPAFTAIGQSLGADAGTLQISLSVFIAALAVGQLFYGPLTERFGRRRPLMIGILLFTVASVLVALARDMETFLLARALQGLGAAAGLVIPRTIVADLFAPRDGAKVFSLLMQVMMISPIAAPPLGGLLLGVLGWRAIFWMLALIGVLAAIATLRIVPESLEPEARRPSGIGSALATYARLLRQGRFAAYVLSGGFVMAGLFVYIGGSSFIFVEYYGLTPTAYSLVFAGFAFGVVVGGFVNIRLLNRWREDQLLLAGLLGHMGFGLLLVATLLAGFDRLAVFGPLLFLSQICLSLVFGNVTALAMGSAPGDSGSASSLFGVVQYMFAGVAGAVLGLLHDGTLRPPAILMLLCALAAFAASQLGARSGRGRTPCPVE